MIVLSEQQVITGYKGLNREARRRVLDKLIALPEDDFDFDKWFVEFVAISERVRNEVGTDRSVTGIEILRELRGEK